MKTNSVDIAEQQAPEVIKRRKRRSSKLTIKQQRFVEALPTSKTLKEASIKAGYSESGASVSATNNLNNFKVQQALSGSGVLAVQVLTNELSNDDANIRVKSADILLKHQPKTEISQTFDLEDLI